MKTRPTICAVLFATAATFVPVTRAQLTEPLRVGNVHPLTDVFERNLDGPAYSPPARIDVFAVRLGRPATFLTNTYVGANASPGKGYFSVTIPNRPATDTTLRVVAYDAATSNEASYFRSASAPVPASGRLLLDFSAPQPMAKFGGDADAAYADALERLHSSGIDSDGDGRSDWEEVLASIDSDGDGMSDWEEMLAGTDSRDNSSLMAFESIETPEASGTARSSTVPEPVLVVVQWQSVPGRTYQLQYSPSLLPGEVDWQDVGDTITAETGETSIRVEVEMADSESASGGHFRISLVRSPDTI